MNMKMIHMSLLGSSSSLGVNWIYDKKLMSDFTKNNNILFLPIQHQLYKKAKNGYNVYKNHKVGDLDFMGEVAYIFHEYLLGNSKDLNFKDYLYKKIGPESDYDGYIEQYGKELIKTIDNKKIFTDHIDKQLISSALFIIGFAHDLDINTIMNYTKILTAFDQTINFDYALNHVFRNLKATNKTSVLNESIRFLGRDYEGKMKASLSNIDIDTFIDKFSGIACGLEQSFPLVYYIVNNTDSFKEALQINASLGGASSARGFIIGAIYSIIDDIPTEFSKIINKKI